MLEKKEKQYLTKLSQKDRYENEKYQYL